MLTTGLSVVALQTLLSGDLLALTIGLAAWRTIGLLCFMLMKPSAALKVESKEPQYRAIVRNRSFLLYFVPWIMFSLVNYLTTPALKTVFDQSTISTLLLVENVLGGAFSVIGGFLIDTVGRKRMAIVGFVALGLGCAVLGLMPASSFSWYFHTAVDGIAWGILLVVFVTTLWGDLSNSAPSDKYYAVGVMPFFVSRFLPLALADQIKTLFPETGEANYAIFSFLTFFLFIAVLPLVYAPETLPEKVVRERELKTYLEKAQEIASKSQEKDKKAKEEDEDEDSVKFEVPQRDAEEAEELAQKYY